MYQTLNSPYHIYMYGICALGSEHNDETYFNKII